uniref:DDE Tnp4 domain-containing protein n=1 Tax=Brassica oleracea var. oleracea TaxID=109376 RepID=A0A0D3AKW9_BRAOL
MASSSNNTFDGSIDDSFDQHFDQHFDEYFDQTFEKFPSDHGNQEREKKKKKKRIYIERNREEGDRRLWDDYFSETPTYPHNLFRRRFRMNKGLFMRIVNRLSNEVEFFQQKRDALGRLSLSPLQKSTTAIRVLAYGNAADGVDEYLRLGASTTLSCLENFVDGIISLFGEEYLRRPTPADLQRLLDIGEYCGFPGMIGSIDCMHWEWKNCPTAWKGQYSRGSGKPTIVLEAVASYDLWICHAFFGPPVLFAQQQEAVRKDVERAFGVLQARFDIVKNPALFWDKVKIGKIMRASIILHNMIVEDERDGYTQFNVTEFQEAEDNGSSHVDLSYSTNMPSNISNMMDARRRIRDRQLHQQLKDDLVEHIWQINQT